jgi:hypothetical protein
MTLTLNLLEGVRLGRSEAAGRIEDNDQVTVEPSTPLSLYLPSLLLNANRTFLEAFSAPRKVH